MLSVSTVTRLASSPTDWSYDPVAQVVEHAAEHGDDHRGHRRGGQQSGAGTGERAAQGGQQAVETTASEDTINHDRQWRGLGRSAPTSLARRPTQAARALTWGRP